MSGNDDPAKGKYGNSSYGSLEDHVFYVLHRAKKLVLPQVKTRII
jgi:hypothetical protein